MSIFIANKIFSGHYNLLSRVDQFFRLVPILFLYIYVRFYRLLYRRVLLFSVILSRFVEK